MARPVQLRYNDASNGETVIGTYLTDDNLIQQGDMKNSGSGEYTQMEIIGDKQLKDNLPIDYSEYGQAQNSQNEPEILVYVYDDNGNFTLRDRVFPEKQGSLDDQGKYRNDELWGFQKWVGRKRVTGVSEQNSTLTTIVDELLPNGYKAVTPGGDSVPTLENYTFNGKVDKALRDLIRDYSIKIWFTSELDGGDYVVKVQSKGFGGVVETVTFTDERQDEGYQIIEFDDEDKTDVVNKVEVAGVLDDGTKVDASTSGSLPVTDSSSISSHGERYLYRHIGYLDSEQQAIDTANDLLNPDPSARARIAIPFQDQNILNASIDIKDDRYGIDAVYTVVQQRDFFTEGKTEVVLGFEKNRSEQRRNLDRDTDEQQHRLFPTETQQDNLGNIPIDDTNTNTETVEDQYDADSQNNHGHSNSNVTSGANQLRTNFVNSKSKNNPFTGGGTANSILSATMPGSGVSGGIDFTYVAVDLFAFNLSASGDVEVEIENSSTTTSIETKTVTLGSSSNIFLQTALDSSINIGAGDQVDVNILTNDANADIEASMTCVSQQNHDHGVTIPDTDGNTADITINVNTGDSSAGDTSNLTVSGQTVEQIVEILTATEDKTDR